MASKFQASLTLRQKADICKHVAQHPKSHLNDIATCATQEFHLIRPRDSSIISCILKRKDYWESAAAGRNEAKRICILNHLELNIALIHFVLDCQQYRILLNGLLIVKKAHQLAEYLNITDAKFFHR